jgi:hypothetical protein
MENKLLHKIFLYITLATITFVAVYSLIIDYKFPEYQLNYFFTLFYLILSLNFLGGNSDKYDRKERLIWLIENKQNIFLYCILSASFSIIFINSGISSFKTALIIFSSLLFYSFSLFIFSKRITLILFWINFYLFAGVIIFSQFPCFHLDTISRYNPFGGLLVTLLA